MKNSLADLTDLEDRYFFTVPFGKYRGCSLLYIAKNDARYLSWLASTEFGAEHAEEIDRAIHAAFLRKVRAAEPPTLTEHQLTRADALVDAVKSGRRIVRLEGGAGYGKSYVTKELVRALAKLGYVSRAMAVSYVATQVLSEQLDPYGVECGTVARMLKFAKSYDDQGQEVYSHSTETPAEAAKLLGNGYALIVDECSMIPDRDARLLFDTVEACGGLLVLVGDSYQLPPVKQEHVSICCTDLPESAVSALTVPMRYSEDSRLFQIERIMRDEPYRLFANGGPLDMVAEDVERVDSKDAMLHRYKETYLDDPRALHRMLLFRRKDVVSANNAIRSMLWGFDAPVLVEDEQLMILATTDTLDDIRYYSGKTYRVVKLEEDTYYASIDGVEFPIPHYRVRLDDGLPPVRLLFGVTESAMDTSKLGGTEFQTAQKAARDYALKTDPYGNRVGDWEPYRKLNKAFLRVAYTYATSVHRSQGQTVDYAYCIPGDLLAVRGIMGRALAYVACTRARKRLTVLA